MFHLSLVLMNFVLYVTHNAAESTLKVQRDWNESFKTKRIKPLFSSHGFCRVRVEQHSGASHPLSRSLSWNHSSPFWNWLHRGFGAPRVGDRVEGNGQHLCYQLSWLKPPGKRFIWRATVAEGTQHFPTSPCLFLYYMVCFSQTPVCLFVSFGQDAQWWRSLEKCCLATMAAVKGNLFIKCVCQSLSDCFLEQTRKNKYKGEHY